MTLILVAFWFLIGIFVAEYIQLVSDRQSFLASFWGRSKCDHCHEELPYWVLLPFVGPLLAKNMCVHCGKQIAKKYFWFEILFAICWGITLYLLFTHALLTPIIVTAALTAFSLSALLMYEDYRHYSVPVFWLIAGLGADVWLWYVLGNTRLYLVDIVVLFGMLSVSLLVVRILKRNVIHSFKGMFGLADFIVLLVLVMLIGYTAMTYVLIFTAITAVVYLLLEKRLKAGQRLPFLTLFLPWALVALLLMQ